MTLFQTMAQQPEVFLGDASIPWRTTGHRWLGKKVRRIFSPGVETNAVIVAWVPEEGDDQALWHVRHPDGDEEDLEAEEVDVGDPSKRIAVCCCLYVERLRLQLL